ncbi:MAG: hypothetical protein FJ161_04685 [Gammaproteobacteria bacterium]|nr:hypothetical protein [Gammaproteobacteria bacterium]
MHPISAIERLKKKKWLAVQLKLITQLAQEYLPEGLVCLKGPNVLVNCTPLKGACFPSSNINKLIWLDFLF